MIFRTTEKMWGKALARAMAASDREAVFTILTFLVTRLILSIELALARTIALGTEY